MSQPTKHEEFEAFYKYQGSFKDFALDFYGVETTQDMDTQEPNLTGPEELIVAHIAWKLTFGRATKLMVSTPNDRLAHHWHQLVIDALQVLPEYISSGCKVIHRQINTRLGGNSALFRTCNGQIARGMTLDVVYVIEPPLISPKTLHEFVQTIAFTTLRRNSGQIFRYTRGY